MGNRKTPAKGNKEYNLRRICVSFDENVFKELRRKAKEEGTSFNEQVRLHVEWGLESVKKTKGYCDNV